MLHIPSICISSTQTELPSFYYSCILACSHIASSFSLPNGPHNTCLHQCHFFRMHYASVAFSEGMGARHYVFRCPRTPYKQPLHFQNLRKKFLFGAIPGGENNVEEIPFVLFLLTSMAQKVGKGLLTWRVQVPKKT